MLRPMDEGRPETPGRRHFMHHPAMVMAKRFADAMTEETRRPPSGPFRHVRSAAMPNLYRVDSGLRHRAESSSPPSPSSRRLATPPPRAAGRFSDRHQPRPEMMNAAMPERGRRRHGQKPRRQRWPRPATSGRGRPGRQWRLQHIDGIGENKVFGRKKSSAGSHFEGRRGIREEHGPGEASGGIKWEKWADAADEKPRCDRPCAMACRIVKAGRRLPSSSSSQSPAEACRRFFSADARLAESCAPMYRWPPAARRPGGIAARR